MERIVLFPLTPLTVKYGFVELEALNTYAEKCS